MEQWYRALLLLGNMLKSVLEKKDLDSEKVLYTKCLNHFWREATLP